MEADCADLAAAGRGDSRRALLRRSCWLGRPATFDHLALLVHKHFDLVGLRRLRLALRRSRSIGLPRLAGALLRGGTPQKVIHLATRARPAACGFAPGCAATGALRRCGGAAGRCPGGRPNCFFPSVS